MQKQVLLFAGIVIVAAVILYIPTAWSVTVNPGPTFINSQTNYTSGTTFNASSIQVQPNHIYLGSKYYDLTTSGGKVAANVTSFYENQNVTVHIINSSLTNVNMTVSGQATRVSIDSTFYNYGARWYYINGNNSTLINVQSGRTVFVDFVTPTAITSTDPRLESSGEQRASYFDGTNNWIFYYDGSNLVYRYSPNGGLVWSVPASTGSGTLATSSYFTVYGEGNTVIISYANSTNVLTEKGTINDTSNSIGWQPPVSVVGLGSKSGQNYYPSFEKVDNNLFLGFNVVTKGNNAGIVYVSTNLGTSWSFGTLLYGKEAQPGIVGVAKYANTKAIAIFANYAQTEFTYETFNGTSWSLFPTSTTGAGLTANANKTQAFSITSNGTCAWVGYVQSNSGGNPKSMTYCGSFSSPTTINTGTALYPTISSIGNNIYLFYVNSTNNVVSRFLNAGGIWGQTVNPFGTVFSSPAFPHAEKYGYGGHHVPVMWREGSSSPYTVKFGITNVVWGSGSVVSCSPCSPTPTPAVGKQVESESTVYQPTQNILVTGLTQLATSTVNTDIYRSTDGGLSWANVTAVQKAPRADRAGDPVATVDKNGKLYLAYENDNSANSGNPGYILIASSPASSAGQSWNYATVISSTALQDKPWIAADRSDNATTQNHVYLCWSDFTNNRAIINFDSLNGTGVPQQFGSNSNGCAIAIGPHGAVFLSYLNSTSQTIQLARSFNGGAAGSWMKVNASRVNLFPYVTYNGSSFYGIHGYQGSFIRVTNYPSMDVDSSGVVHMAWADYNPSSKHGDIKYIESTTCNRSNDTCTFSNATTIDVETNAINPSADRFEPVLIVSNETSPPTVHVTVNDRVDDINNVYWRPYDYSCSSQCLNQNSWYDSMIINRASTNYDYKSNVGWFVGDYHGLAYSKYREAIANWNDHNYTNTVDAYDIWGDWTR